MSRELLVWDRPGKRECWDGYAGGKMVYRIYKSALGGYTLFCIHTSDISIYLGNKYQLGRLKELAEENYKTSFPLEALSLLAEE